MLALWHISGSIMSLYYAWNSIRAASSQTDKNDGAF